LIDLYTGSQHLVHFPGLLQSGLFHDLHVQFLYFQKKFRLSKFPNQL
jgi:hypothetical protein